MRRFRPFLILGLVVLSPATARATFYQQTNLVTSSQAAAAAPNTDPNLKNPWGVSFSNTSPFWVSNAGSGTSTLYNSAGVPNALVVTIPGGGPTGQVNNADPNATDFVLPNGTKASFIFDSLAGTVTGWNGGTTAQTMAMPAGTNNSYTGLTQAQNGTNGPWLLYAANNGTGKIDVYNSSWQLTNLSGSFTDPNLPSGFSPYNISEIRGTNILYVTYKGASGGVVDTFDLNGNFLARISANGAGGTLSRPWGLALAPSTFGDFAGALLVGNEGDGRISAFNPTTGQLLGQLTGSNGQPLSNGFGLWALNFGISGNNGNPNTLYIATGLVNESQGLLAAITVVPEPGSVTLFLLGSVGLFLGRRFLAARAE
jgi:uncharacterized protein (TIGR03118 family)